MIKHLSELGDANKDKQYNNSNLNLSTQQSQYVPHTLTFMFDNNNDVPETNELSHTSCKEMALYYIYAYFLNIDHNRAKLITNTNTLIQFVVRYNTDTNAVKSCNKVQIEITKLFEYLIKLKYINTNIDKTFHMRHIGDNYVYFSFDGAIRKYPLLISLILNVIKYYYSQDSHKHAINIALDEIYNDNKELLLKLLNISILDLYHDEYSKNFNQDNFTTKATNMNVTKGIVLFILNNYLHLLNN